ncbi:MAG TPA: Flp family type IVb pilin [Aurantimonas sp.]
MLIWPVLCRRFESAFSIAMDLRREPSGATAVEYALIAGIISLAIIVGATAIGTNLNGLFAAVAAAF